jgi:uncharacterized membrane protein YraQ (UPF0718 family)
MKRLSKAYLLFLALMVLDLVILAMSPASGKLVFRYTFSNFYQMLGVIPPVFILLGLLDVWVPRETMMRYLGPGSGLKGAVISLMLGAVAAGPLYGAFPVAAAMARKGASFTNILILIGSWSTLKIPMFLFETASLGPAFAITRALVDIPGVVLLAWIIARWMPAAEVTAFYARHAAAEKNG